MDTSMNETQKDSDLPKSEPDPGTDETKDEVDEQSEESFPASDPPSY